MTWQPDTTGFSTLTVIDAAYHIVSYALMGVVLGAWH